MSDPPAVPLSASWSFFKGHGHGNDYLVFEEGNGWPVQPDRIRLVCDRHRGPGSDGMVVVRRTAGSAVPTLRMFNPDGAEFERSGNGLRVVASYLYLAGRVADQPFRVRIGGVEVTMRIVGVSPDGDHDVVVDMGRVAFGPDAVDMDADPGPAPDGPVETGQLDHPVMGGITVHPVSVGNPHAVCFRDRLDVSELEPLGAWISGHPKFRNGTNVQLAHVDRSGRLSIHIWERGVGRTTSSGTSACAAAAAAVRSGRMAGGRVVVAMEGGDFHVTVGPDFEVLLQGPVTPVFYGTLASGLLEGTP